MNSENERINIAGLGNKAKNEIAEYIKDDNLSVVNSSVVPVTPKISFYTKYGKRFFDFILSLFAVIITLPINLVIAVITLFDVGRPIIFKQVRIGKNKKQFYIYKFRNMTNEVDAKGELLPPAQRVTKWGKIARKTSLDELMNFISILKGDMSFIGPRPLLKDYTELFSDYHQHRFDVKPGLECPTPIKLDHAVTWNERLDNDVWYVQNCSLLNDIKLVFRIVQVALDSKTTSTRGEAKAGRFLGYEENGMIISSHSVPKKYCDRYCVAHGYSSIDEAMK